MRFNQLNEKSSLPLSQEVSGLLGRGETVYIQIDDTNVEEVVGVNLAKDKRTVIVGFGKSRKSIPVHNDTYEIDDSEGYNVIRKLEESTKQEIPMTNKKINEGVLSEDEETGVMAKYTLYMLAKGATRLHKLIQDEEVITPEVLDLLQAALSSINTIKMDYDEVDEAITNPRSGGYGLSRTIGNLPSVQGIENKVADERWEAARAAKAKAKAKPARGGLRALFAGDTNSVITRRRTEISDEGSVGFIYKDGIEQGMYDFDLGADAFFFNNSSFDTMDDIAASLGGEFSWEESDMLDNVTESSDSRPYVVFHNKKGRYETHAATSFEAAKQAAAHWKLKSTAGVSAHAADVEHVAEETKITKRSIDNWNAMYGADAIEFGTEIINQYNIHDSSEQQYIIEIIDSYTDEFDIRDPADRKKLARKMSQWWMKMTGKSIKNGSQFDESDINVAEKASSMFESARKKANIKAKK
jgi:hypothetical protein